MQRGREQTQVEEHLQGRAYQRGVLGQEEGQWAGWGEGRRNGGI